MCFLSLKIAVKSQHNGKNTQRLDAGMEAWTPHCLLSEEHSLEVALGALKKNLFIPVHSR